MAEVKRKADGQIIPIPDDQLGEAVASGEFLIPKGIEIPVLDDTGQLNFLPSEHFDTGGAAQAGFTPATQAQIIEARNQREFGEGVVTEARAVGEAALRGVSAGFGDAALVALGADPEGIAEREKRSALAPLVEVGALGASVLASGGTLGLARGGAAAATAGAGLRASAPKLASQALKLTPTSLAARAGRRAEGALAEALGGGAVARAASSGLVGAAEGSLFSLGEATSRLATEGEAVLGDSETVAEYLLAAAEDGALLGAPIGAGASATFSGFGALAQKGKDLIFRRTAAVAADEATEAATQQTIARELGKDINDPAVLATLEQRTGQAISEDLAETGVKTDKGTIDRVLKQRRASREFDDLAEARTLDMAEVGSRQEDIFDEALDTFNIANKLKQSRKLIAADEAAGRLDDFDHVVVEAVDEIGKLKNLVNQIAKDTGAEFNQQSISAAKRLLKPLADETDLKIRKILVEGGPEARAETFALLDTLKREVGRTHQRLGGRGSGFGAGPMLRDHYDSMRKHLENESFYGRGATDLQIPENRAWVQWFEAADAFRVRFLSDLAAGGPDVTGFGTLKRFGSQKASNYLRNLGQAANHDAERVFLKHVEATENLIQTFAQTRKPTGKLKGLVSEHKANSEKMLKLHNDMLETATDKKAFDDLAKDFSGIPGVPGIAKAAVVLAEKTSDLTQRARTAKGVEAKFDRALKKFGERLKQTGKLGKRAIVPLGIKVKEGETKYDLYKRKRDHVSRLVANPEAMANLAQPLTSNRAPEISAAVAGTAVRAANFMAQKIPSERRSQIVRPDLDKAQRISDAELNKFLRYLEAVEDPMAVIEAAAEGDVTREGVEVLREVYPKMYERLVDRVSDQISQLDAPPPMSSMVQLSIILGQPMHFSMRPAFINAHQQMYAEQNGAADVAGEGEVQNVRSPGSRADLNQAGSLQTPAQAVEARG